MAKKAKGNRVQVILECTEHKESGMPGTSRYITTKNRKNTTERLELKKYNPENGWGTYEQLLEFTKEFQMACIDNQDCKIKIYK